MRQGVPASSSRVTSTTVRTGAKRARSHQSKQFPAWPYFTLKTSGGSRTTAAPTRSASGQSVKPTTASSGYSSSTSIRPCGHARSGDAPKLQAGGTATPGPCRGAHHEGPVAEWSPSDERATRHVFDFVPTDVRWEFTHSSRSGLPLASCVSGRACAFFWCHVPRRKISHDVLIVSIPTNPLSSQNAATSGDEQEQPRPGPTSEFTPIFPVISLLTKSPHS